jgi:EmrB/QacA subfamily drug resistance transporter
VRDRHRAGRFAVSQQVRYATAPGRWILAATVLGSGMASIDATVVGIALPSIGRDLHSSLSALQWVVSGYMLTLASLLLPAGALGDQLGRRKMFNVGVVWFTVASVACAVAPGATVLILMRTLQGVGAALLTPGSLAIIEASFDEESRGQAIGAWSGLGGVATALGPLLGGYLIAAASWRWIFVINVPIGVAVFWMSSRHVPESRDQNRPDRVDVRGSLLAVTTLVGITYGLIQGPASGWGHPDVVALLLVGAASAVAFFFAERSAANPMLPLSAFRNRQFTVTNVVTFIIYGALGGALFLFPVELQVVDHYTPLESGVSLLPLTVIMLLLSARSGKLAARIGPRLQMSVGPLIVGAGVALLARSTTDSWYPTGVLPAVVLFGLGLATTVAPLTSTAMNALSAERAGLASAVNNDVARTGSLIAVAILPAIAGLSGRTYLHAGPVSSGFRTATAVSAVFCALGGAISAVGIQNRVPGRPAVECMHCALDATPAVAARS